MSAFSSAMNHRAKALLKGIWYHYVTKKVSINAASHKMTFLQSVFFSLKQISLFLRGTMILSAGKKNWLLNTNELTSAQICFSIS